MTNTALNHTFKIRLHQGANQAPWSNKTKQTNKRTNKQTNTTPLTEVEMNKQKPNTNCSLSKKYTVWSIYNVWKIFISFNKEKKKSSTHAFLNNVLIELVSNNFFRTSRTNAMKNRSPGLWPFSGRYCVTAPETSFLTDRAWNPPLLRTSRQRGAGDWSDVRILFTAVSLLSKRHLSPSPKA